MAYTHLQWALTSFIYQKCRINTWRFRDYLIERFKSRGTASTGLADVARAAIRNPNITGPAVAFGVHAAAMPISYHPSDYLLLNTAANAYGAFDQFKYGMRLLSNGEPKAATHAMAASFWSTMNALVSSIPFADLILTGDPMRLQYWGAELPAIGALTALAQINLATARKLEENSKKHREFKELDRRFAEGKRSLSDAELDRLEDLALEFVKRLKDQQPYKKTDHSEHGDYVSSVNELRNLLIRIQNEAIRRSSPDPSLN